MINVIGYAGIVVLVHALLVLIIVEALRLCARGYRRWRLTRLPETESVDETPDISQEITGPK